MKPVHLYGWRVVQERDGNNTPTVSYSVAPI